MRLILEPLLLALVATASGAVMGPVKDRQWNLTAALELPKCVTDCAIRVLPAHNCSMLDPVTSLPSDCYCASSGPLASELSTCVLDDCETIAEGVAGLKFQARSCDYPRDRSRTTSLFVVTVAMFTATTLFLIARFLSRWPRLQGAGLSWDDAVVLACYMPVLGITVVSFTLVHDGAGRDAWVLPTENVVTSAKWFWAVVPIYIVAVFCTKLSLVYLYLRIWPGQPGRRSSFRIACKVIAVALVLTALACVCSYVFACRPISAGWRYANTGPPGVCTQRVKAGYGYGALNVMFDVIVIVLPIPRLAKLQVSSGQKFGICSCFLVGFVATACSVARLTQLNGLYNGKNITWDYLPAGVWSLIEVYCSMICCCMPSMAGLLQRCYHHGKVTSIDSTPSFEMVSASVSEKGRVSGVVTQSLENPPASPLSLIRPDSGRDGFVTYMPTAELPPMK